MSRYGNHIIGDGSVPGDDYTWLYPTDEQEQQCANEVQDYFCSFDELKTTVDVLIAWNDLSEGADWLKKLVDEYSDETGVLFEAEDIRFILKERLSQRYNLIEAGWFKN